MPGELRFHVAVDHENVDVGVLEASIGAFARVVRAVGGARWTVTQLELASITAAARPDVDVDVEFQRITAGLSSLSHSADPPVGWSDALLSSIAELEKVVDADGVNAVELSVGERAPVRITRELVRNAIAALDSVPETIGAVTGKVDRFYDRTSKRNFGLIDEATGHAVVVRFAREWEDQVVRSIGQRVTAWGVLRRSPEGHKKEMLLEGLRDAPLLTTPPLGVSQVRGLLGADWTADLDSVEWTRRQRGEE